MKAYNVNFSNQTITITADFAKRMENPGSNEFEIIRKFCEAFPAMKIVRRTHRTPSSYKTKSGEVCRRNQFKDMTYERMERFMNAIPNGAEYRKQYDAVRKLADGAVGSKYTIVRDWFMEQFPEYRNNPIVYLRNKTSIIDTAPYFKRAEEKEAAEKIKTA